MRKTPIHKRLKAIKPLEHNYTPRDVAQIYQKPANENNQPKLIVYA